ncbi:major facilitator superfamily-related transporter, putative [Plasmodium knowlesi strain H]|uniref:Major facilitator superfamily-related transporter, putative n=2 Tax=Plasmodium knowlesi TaxID=5850 RepID=B3L7R1_PLAKH|nr:major facilitator superfamily-related transporter, putative [Plasmodium knowlesi strain H]OTN64799.1 Uncharacterized protein PKNOH_S130202200 [Plasmodium knowlesi]CAA9989182.1 major facilitator superfamily-related transporter, putative [Plasmodium knowlesi strain H]VVS78656.1 major facilitator superfamily-related transporter, putative [Plasmodium knowlesi strain H]|eukprot:XP_002261529.1 hypothetical protein, conserved in Plasmodium species [Plasmodium knowlesi strain H]
MKAPEKDEAVANHPKSAKGAEIIGKRIENMKINKQNEDKEAVKEYLSSIDNEVLTKLSCFSGLGYYLAKLKLKVNKFYFIYTILTIINFAIYVNRGIIPGSYDFLSSYLREKYATSNVDVHIGFLTSVFVFGLSISSIISGSLASTYSVFRITDIFLFQNSLALLMTGFSFIIGSYYSLMFSRFFCGFSEAAFITIIPPLIYSYSKDRAGSWISIFITMFPLGGCMGYLLAVLLPTFKISIAQYFTGSGVIFMIFFFLFYLFDEDLLKKYEDEKSRKEQQLRQMKQGDAIKDVTEEEKNKGKLAKGGVSSGGANSGTTNKGVSQKGTSVTKSEAANSATNSATTSATSTPAGVVPRDRAIPIDASKDSSGTSTPSGTSQLANSRMQSGKTQNSGGHNNHNLTKKTDKGIISKQKSLDEEMHIRKSGTNSSSVLYDEIMHQTSDGVSFNKAKSFSSAKKNYSDLNSNAYMGEIDLEANEDQEQEYINNNSYINNNLDKMYLSKSFGNEGAYMNTTQESYDRTKKENKYLEIELDNCIESMDDEKNNEHLNLGLLVNTTLTNISFLILVIALTAHTDMVQSYLVYGAPILYALKIFPSYKAATVFCSLCACLSSIIGNCLGGFLMDSYNLNIQNVDKNYEHINSNEKKIKIYSKDVLVYEYLRIIGFQTFIILIIASSLVMLIPFITNIYMFTFVMTLGMTFLFSAMPGHNIGVMVCVPQNIRAFSIGMSSFISHLLGDIPWTIIIGKIKGTLSPDCVVTRNGELSERCFQQSRGLRVTLFIICSKSLIMALASFLLNVYAKKKIMRYKNKQNNRA